VIGPARGEEITISVPQREQILARVDDVEPRHLDLCLLVSPRTSIDRLGRTKVFVQFVNASGVCRLIGRLTRPPVEGRLVVVGYGAGEIIRFEHTGVVQLLKRPEFLVARVAAPITMLRVGFDHVAVEGVTVDVGGAGLTVRGLPAADENQLYQFDLRLLDHEPPISGQFRVDHVTYEGHVEAHFTVLGAQDRGRLVHFAYEHGPSKAA
jgi:hypothetical protein